MHVERARDRIVDVVRFAFRSSKRIAVTVLGAVLVLGGIAMLVLPGPGLLVVVAGFAVLGTEYAWAAAALDRTRATAERAGRVARDTAGRAGQVAVDGARGAGRAAKGLADGISGTVRRSPGTDGTDAPDDGDPAAR